MVPAVEIGVVEELSSCGALYLAPMKCSMEHVEAAMGIKLDGGSEVSQSNRGGARNKTGKF